MDGAGSTVGTLKAEAKEVAKGWGLWVPALLFMLDGPDGQWGVWETGKAVIFWLWTAGNVWLTVPFVFRLLKRTAGRPGGSRGRAGEVEPGRATSTVVPMRSDGDGAAG
ncbi:hypothetical protein ACFC0D_23160 [Streptomyces sp. NPDC056222]|uniref:hypothetical protein n=1 Tax=Streptomyces sp. NPDC056222 TaxID=3345749 RepID=UPI0035DFE1CA